MSSDGREVIFLLQFLKPPFPSPLQTETSFAFLCSFKLQSELTATECLFMRRPPGVPFLEEVHAATEPRDWIFLLRLLTVSEAQTGYRGHSAFR